MKITLKIAAVITVLLLCPVSGQSGDKNVVRSERHNALRNKSSESTAGAKNYSVSPYRPYYIQPKPKGSVGRYTRYHFRGYPVYPPSTKGRYGRRYHSRRIR
jgi:hypothetical protein